MSEPQMIRLPSTIFLTLVALTSLQNAPSSARLLSRRQAASTSNDTTAQELADFVRFLGPRNQVDFVAILQRNQGMGKRNFYTAIRPAMEALTLQYATLHPSYVRMAVVTFSNNVSVVYDHITNWEGAKTKCEVFGGTSPLWDTVVYNNSDTIGANIGQALNITTAILIKGKQNRPSVTQVVMVVTDGDFTVSDDPLPYLPRLQKDMQVKMFAAGLGAWFKPVSVAGVASKQSYYGLMDPHWKGLLATVPSSVASDVSPLLSRLPDSATCDATSGSVCSDVSSGCFCDVDTGVAECRCDAGHSRLQSSSSSSSSPVRCQVCPVDTYRSELDDDSTCLPCSPGYGTGQSSNGSSAGCQCLSGTNCTADPCAAGTNPCSANEVCSVNPTTGNTTCSCRPGFTSPSCSVNPNDCPSSQCLHGASCYDRLGGVQCVCPFGFRGEQCGAQCGAQQDYCAFDICVKNQTLSCTSPPNNYVCTCLFGYIGDFCENQDPNPTRSTVTTPAGLTNLPSLSPSSPSAAASSSSSSSAAAAAATTATTTAAATAATAAATASVNSSATTPYVNASSPSASGSVNGKDEGGFPVKLIIIIVCVVGGVLLILLLVLVVVIATSRRRNRRREEEEKAAAAGAGAAGVRVREAEGTRRRSKRPESFQTPRRFGVRATGNRLSQTISDRFSGLWKKWTVRTHDPSEWYSAGVPSVPKRRPGLDEFNDPHLVDRDEAILKNEVIVVGDQLSGWNSYLQELEKTGVIEGGIIAQSDTHDCAKTRDWRVDWTELEALEKAIDSRSTKATVRVQGQTYQMTSNDGTMATAVSEYNSTLIMGVTKCYLVAGVVGVADASDSEKSTKEIQWIVDHITAEGY